MIRDDINTATEERIVSALCRNLTSSTFWGRLDDTLFVNKQAKVLFKVIPSFARNGRTPATSVSLRSPEKPPSSGLMQVLRWGFSANVPFRGGADGL